MILLIDNYDSFTFNLFQCIETLGAKCTVKRNDQISCSQIRNLRPDGIVISPGPGRPEDAGVVLSVIKEFSGIIPILGICLGHQAIAQAFGAQVITAPRPRHGKTSSITHDGQGVFSGLHGSFVVARYHSLVVDEKTLPSQFVVSARTSDGLVMGLRHQTLKVEGVQFHPESAATENGLMLIGNFLSPLKERNCG